LPVRIELEAEDLQAHPLRIGLSMQVTVDLRDADTGTGKAPPKTVLPADVLDDSAAALEAARVRIAAIIRQHQTTDDKTNGR
jgi:membrane fusion protein (multidrug efflux system)